MDLTAALEALSGVNARVQNLEDNFMLSGKEFHSERSPERQRGTHDTPGLETALRHLGSLNARVEHISGRPTTALLYSTNLSDERQGAQWILSGSDDEVQDMLREQRKWSLLYQRWQRLHRTAGVLRYDETWQETCLPS